MGRTLFQVFGIGAPICAGIFAFFLIRSINKRDAGSDRMRRIAGLIRRGAMAFLRVEYSVLAVFVGLMFVILVVFLPRSAVTTAVSFLVGAILSASAGWVGMYTAPGAAVRATHDAWVGGYRHRWRAAGVQCRRQCSSVASRRPGAVLPRARWHDDGRLNHVPRH